MGPQASGIGQEGLDVVVVLEVQPVRQQHHDDGRHQAGDDQQADLDFEFRDRTHGKEG